MKKRNIVIIISILVIAGLAILGFLYYEDVRVREPYKPYSTTEKYAYSVKESENEIEFIMYGLLEDIPKIATIYQFENDSLIQIYRKYYYKNNKIARLNFNSDKQGQSDMTDAKRNQNVIKGILTSEEGELGQSKSEKLEQLKQFENIYTKIEL